MPRLNLGFLVILLFVGAILTGSCASAPKKKPLRDAESAAIESLWQFHQSVILDAMVDEVAVDSQEFEGAIQFFEDNTGILSGTGTYFGRIPTEDLGVSLAKWNRWYKEHHDRLTLNPQFTCRLTLERAPQEP